MCHKQTTMMSPLPVKLAKITVVVIFFCFAECAAGSCLSYGHACWGAHGKRNGAHNNNMPGRDAPPVSRDSTWFLSKLVQSPLDLRYVNDKDLDLPTSQQLFADAQIEADPLKGQEDYRGLPDAYSNEENVLFDIYPNQRPRPNKIKASKYLEKRSTRMI
uniref:CCHamide 1 n=1 Tax=Tenebrio molitor TaxID=7067 RepID=A0A977XCV3_TENMO|nr:CCHamide 1 [Tenebrio molitor]